MVLNVKNSNHPIKLLIKIYRFLQLINLFAAKNYMQGGGEKKEKGKKEKQQHASEASLGKLIFPPSAVEIFRLKIYSELRKLKTWLKLSVGTVACAAASNQLLKQGGCLLCVPSSCGCIRVGLCFSHTSLLLLHCVVVARIHETSDIITAHTRRNRRLSYETFRESFYCIYSWYGVEMFFTSYRNV